MRSASTKLLAAIAMSAVVMTGGAPVAQAVEVPVLDKVAKDARLPLGDLDSFLK